MEQQAVKYGIKEKIYNSYPSAAEILLHINGKFTMRNLNSTQWSCSCLL
jgi:hypothetical protein